MIAFHTYYTCMQLSVEREGRIVEVPIVENGLAIPVTKDVVRRCARCAVSAPFVTSSDAATASLVVPYVLLTDSLSFLFLSS